jgi:hypothetical protein
VSQSRLARVVSTAGESALAWYIHADEAQNPAALARGLAATFGGPLKAYRVVGDYLSLDEASELRSALFEGGTLLVLADGPHPVALRLLNAWAAATRTIITPSGKAERFSSSYWGKVDRHLLFSFERFPTTPATLVFLQAGGEREVRTGWRYRLEADEVAELMQVGSAHTSPSVRTIGVSFRRTEATSLSFKDLCMLHLRDAPHTASDKTPGAASPMRWLELRQTIRTQGPNALPQIRERNQRGLLTDEQRDFFEVAIDFLDGCRTVREKSRADIYEVVWNYEFLEPQGYFFRGQRSSQWKLDTTLLRPNSSTATLDLNSLLTRSQRTSLFLSILRQRESEFFAHSPTDNELLAVAQHYGFATHLLDFSGSLRVAAFFATHGASTKSDASLGVIYYLKPSERRAAEMLDRTRPIGLGGFDLLREAGLQFGEWQTLAPALADANNRIARQRGRFLAGANVRHLNELMLERIIFEQTPGVVFEDPAVGVTAEILLPDSSDLAKLAGEVNDRFARGERAPTHPAIGAISLPAPSVVGVQHAWMSEQVSEASLFFKQLQELAESTDSDSMINGVVDGIREYFVRVRAVAELGSSSLDGPASHSSTPLESAVARMCEAADVDRASIWSTVEKVLPDWEDGTWQAPQIEGEREGRHRLVLACAVYLVGWEHITVVQGARSRSFAIKARELLHILAPKSAS